MKINIQTPQDNQQVNIFDVVNYVINRFSKKYEFTHMKLQKIIFYIYVEYLLKHRQPLFNETAEAWTYGPVYPNLYLALKHNCANVIKDPIKEGNETNLTDDDKKIIDQVVEKYGSWKAGQLVEKVHQESAWQYNFCDSDWSLNVISDEDLYECYGDEKK